MVGVDDLALAGVKVISIEQAVAAPYAGARLADAGAQVTKIERPEGDLARGYDDVAAGQSSYFVWLNRGKKSVTLNLVSAEGKAELSRLLQDCDVLLQNLKPGALARLGFDKDTLLAQFPKLVICSISGFDPQGDMANRKAYDLLIQAEAGLCSITGSPNEPARVGISIVDIATGATAYSAILEALFRREKTGRGCHIDVSMFDVMADWLTVPLLCYEGGKPPARIGIAHPSIAPYGAFQTKDGILVIIAVQNDREWASLSALLLGDAGLAQDERFASNIARVRNRSETDALVRQAVASRSLADVAEILQAASIAFASVNDMAALSVHPQLRRIEVQTPGGPVSYPAPAPVFSDHQRTYGPVPALSNGQRDD